MSMNQQKLIIALYVNPENVTFFDSFGVEHIPENSLKIKILQQNILIWDYNFIVKRITRITIIFGK